MALSHSDRITLIQDLELRDFEPRLSNEMESTSPLVKSDSDAASANVDDGSLVSFVANVSANHKTAALNTTLLAQMAADKAYDRFKEDELMDWYKKYQSVMGICGWVVQEFKFQNYKASGSTFSINEAVISIIESFATEAEIKVAEAALNALKGLKNDSPWYKVWDQQSHSTDGGNFQIASAADNDGAENTLVMKIGAFAFTTTETTTNFLWVAYKDSDTSVQYADQTITLNETIYDKLADTITDKLGDNAKTQIGALDI